MGVNEVQVFGRQWFINKQKYLLFLLNNPLTRSLMRNILDIHSNKRIINITPFEYTESLGNGRVGTEFHIARKFGIRLYSRLAPLWNLCHQFDMFIANKYMPAFNLGFDNLTAYPNANGDTGATTTDGYVQRAVTTSVWSELRNGVGSASGVSSTMGQAVQMAPYISGTQQYSAITRAIFLFDTTTIPSLSTINSATLTVTSAGVANVTAGVTLNSAVYSCSPDSNTTIGNGDYIYTKFGETPFSSVKPYSDWGGQFAAEEFALNDAGKTTGIIPGGITKLALRNVQHDVLNNPPTGTAGSGFANCIQLYFSDDTTANHGYDPKLYVEYTPPSTGYGKVIFISR